MTDPGSTPKLVSKSRFKAKALEYFRRVERTRTPLVITDRGRPVLQLIPYEAAPGSEAAALRGAVLRYDRPTDPVAPDAWEALG